MKPVIEIRRYNIPRPNGDRALRNSDCYDFAIYVNGKLVKEFSQFDGFHCHVNDYEDTLAEVRHMADALADAMRTKRAGDPITYIEERVEKTEWVPANARV